MSVSSAYNIGRVVGRVQDYKVGSTIAARVSLKITWAGPIRCEGGHHARADSDAAWSRRRGNDVNL
jgi:hypothetical protein